MVNVNAVAVPNFEAGQNAHALDQNVLAAGGMHAPIRRIRKSDFANRHVITTDQGQQVRAAVNAVDELVVCGFFTIHELSAATINRPRAHDCDVVCAFCADPHPAFRPIVERRFGIQRFVQTGAQGRARLDVQINEGP